MIEIFPPASWLSSFKAMGKRVVDGFFPNTEASSVTDCYEIKLKCPSENNVGNVVVGMSILMAVTLAGLLQVAQSSEAFKQSPMLDELVNTGKLPVLKDRLPVEYKKVDFSSENKQTGKYGGKLRLLMGKQKDTRMVTVYGYARLVAFTPDLKIEPDLLRAIDVEENKVFVFHLRNGHKWSDGNPFTAEDFRYYWEDIANNEILSPGGPPRSMIVDGKSAKFEVINDYTVRYSWDKPNNDFLIWLAGALPAAIYRPAHYLKQFHMDHGDANKLSAIVKDKGYKNWSTIHFRKDRPYRADNPDQPTLQPWINTTKPPADRFVYFRNPYYHRVDDQGQQLPYIDEIVVQLGTTNMIPARTGTGESDLQARYLSLQDYTFLKKSGKKNKFDVKLWPSPMATHKAIYPNFNAEDPLWRELIRDVRFRRALSIAIDRDQINQVVYFGIANPSANTVLKSSSLYKKEYQTKWATYDPKKANDLLDELGLTKRNSEGIRLLPDGRPMYMIIDTAGENTEETDILELVRDHWKKVGIKLFPRASTREVFRNRVGSGKAILSMWGGLGYGLVNATMNPRDYTPTSRLQHQWPKWGHYGGNNGQKGEKPELESVNRLIELQIAWQKTADKVEQEKIWHEILQINADNVFTIGLINSNFRPVVVNSKLRNIPSKGMYYWNPGAYFGIFKPDTFWFEK